MGRARVAAAVLVLATVSGAVAGSGCTAAQLADALNSAIQDCSVPGQNRFVRDTLKDVYLWYKELPDPDPASFTTPEAYLEAVRYKALDKTFSFITGRAANDALTNDSQYVGFGFKSEIVSASEIRVADVYAGGPAADAGLERGAGILEVNGRSAASLISTGETSSIFGPAQVGVSAHVLFRDRAGADHDVQMVKRTVTIPTVAVTTTIASGGRVVGYLLLENFVTPTSAALDAAFTQLEAAGANELILDVRYNGGGLVTVAQHLASLIGGSRTTGQLFIQLAFNDKHSSDNQNINFQTLPHALGLERLVVITTENSASASESMVNGLRPYIPVTVVGGTTYGKPVGQTVFNFCDKVLYAVTFAAKNARGQADFFNGIPADCAAPDDLDHALGDTREGSLAEALRYLRTGSCSASAAAAARAQSAPRPAGRGLIREDGSHPMFVAR
jgi:carboxyl-terminal processing protease